MNGILKREDENKIYLRSHCHVFYEIIPIVRNFLNGRIYVYDIKHKDWVKRILKDYHVRVERPSTLTPTSTLVLGIVAGGVLGAIIGLLTWSLFSKPEG